MDSGNTMEKRDEGEERWTVLGVLSFCHFANDYYAMVIPPLLPFLAKDFQLTFFQSGMLVFMANIVSAFLQPVVGYFSDLKMRRRLAITIGLSFYALTCAALGFVPNYTVLLVILFLMGIGGSTYHPQSTYFIAMYFQRFRATASGIHGIANPIGFVLAPIAVTAIIAATGTWRTAASLMIIPGAVAALLAWRVLDEPQVKGSEGFFLGIVSGPLILLTLASGITLAVFTAFTTFIPFYSQDTSSTIPPSWWLPLTLLPGIASQPLGGLLADQIGRRNLIVMGLGILTVALFGFISTAGSVALVFSMLAGLCLSLLIPVYLIFAAELAVGERVGTAVGVMWGFAMAMASVAPLLVGYLRDVFPDFRMAFLSLVVIALIGAIMSCFLPGQTRNV